MPVKKKLPLFISKNIYIEKNPYFSVCEAAVTYHMKQLAWSEAGKYRSLPSNV